MIKYEMRVICNFYYYACIAITIIRCIFKCKRTKQTLLDRDDTSSLVNEPEIVQYFSVEVSPIPIISTEFPAYIWVSLLNRQVSCKPMHMYACTCILYTHTHTYRNKTPVNFSRGNHCKQKQEQDQRVETEQNYVLPGAWHHA